MIGPVAVDYGHLESAAVALEQMAGDVAEAVPRITAAVVAAGLYELAGYGLFAAIPVAADLVAVCLPGAPGSLPDAAAELVAMAVAVRAAEAAYRAVDVLGWAQDELPTAEALVMLATWNRLHQIVDFTRAMHLPFVPGIVDWAGENVLEQGDVLIEGHGSIRTVDPRTMPALEAAPASGLAALLGVVDTISDAEHPSTAALLQVGDDPPRYVLCLPGLQDSEGADGSAADLPGALATLAGHSAYIRGMRALLATLPAGAQVLLVGHSQGGMVAEALAAQAHSGHVTIAGVLTAGAPTLAAPVAAGLPYLALRNNEDPVPKLGQLASGGIGALAAPGPDVLEFSTPGRWPSLAKHGLGSGGYLAEAGSSDPRVVAFGNQVRAFLVPGPVHVRYVQVTDTDGVLPP